jgi:hypothetical protein
MFLFDVVKLLNVDHRIPSLLSAVSALSGLGAGIAFILFEVVFGFRNFSVTKKPQSRAASA